MSVLIKSMEMPTSCYYCPMTNEGFYLCKANNLYKQLEDDCEERRPNWCPLIPIPAHGRLIDADALMDALTRAKEDDPLQYKEDYFTVSDWLCVAPTVIEADYPPSTPLEQVWTELFGEDGE